MNNQASKSGFLLAALLFTSMMERGFSMDPKSLAAKGKTSAQSSLGVSAAKGKLNPGKLINISRKINRAKGPAALHKNASGPNSPLRSLLSSSISPLSPLTGPMAARLTTPRPTVVNPAQLVPAIHAHWNPFNGTPIFLNGGELQAPALGTGMAANLAPGQRALAYMDANRELFRLENPARELQLLQEKRDGLGRQHAVFRQTYQGIPVWGHELAAHFRTDGELYALNARYAPTPGALGPAVFRIGSSQAIGIAAMDLSGKAQPADLGDYANELLNYHGPQAGKYVWISPVDQLPHWIWHISIRPNIRDNWFYFIDAGTGKILEKYNNTNFDGPATASGADLTGVTRSINTYLKSGSYYMIDASRKTFDTKSTIPGDPRGALWTVNANSTELKQVTQVNSKNNTWSDPASVSAQYNLGRVFDYYFTTFGRLGIDGAGTTIISAIHVTDPGGKMDNAYWTGKIMVYGDGNKSFKSLAAGLDVAGHEMTHGVIQNTVNLEYKSQSGALNESLSDIFGCMVDRDDWKMGEDVILSGNFPSGALRDLENPHNGGNGRNDNGWQPANMSEYQELAVDDDNGGVHVNSGIPNHAGYLIGVAIGREKTEKIYYHLLDAHYLNSTSQFIDMRLAAIRSAQDLYGETSAEAKAVGTAFDAVGILDKAGSTRPVDAPAVDGQDYIAAVNADGADSSLYIVKSVITDDTKDIIQLTKTQVFTGTGNPITIPDDGSLLLFIDSQNAIKLFGDSGEVLISDDIKWKSIAISPNGTKLAATALEPDSAIYIIDIIEPDSSKTVQIYTPTTVEGQKIRDVVNADALDWNSTGEYLLYDAFHQLPQTEGDAIEYWDVNVLDAKTGIITQFYPSLPEGLSMGNPSFAQTSDLNFVFDLFREDGSAYLILAADLFTGEVNVIDSMGTTLGYPRYSSDDSWLVLQRQQSGFPGLQKIALAANKISATAEPINYLSAAQRPQWFSIGTRPAWVRPPIRLANSAIRLNLEAYPSAGAAIKVNFGLPVAAAVDLSVFDMQGRKLATLIHGWENAGPHTFNWDGLGQAGKATTGGMLVFRLTAAAAQGKPMEITRKAFF